MESLIHADIFFFISTIALVIIALGVIVALIYIIKILSRVSSLSKKVKEEGEGIITDINGLRTNIKTEGFKVRYVTSFLSKLFKRRASKKDKEVPQD